MKQSKRIKVPAGDKWDRVQIMLDPETKALALEEAMDKAMSLSGLVRLALRERYAPRLAQGRTI